MNYIIIDDDGDFAQRLRRRLESSVQYSAERDAIFVACSGDEVGDAEMIKADVVFADIVLGGAADGIGMVSRFNDRCPQAQIIYVTSYLKYASAVYDTEHAYFIYKPELEEQFEKALAKALERRKKAEPARYMVSYKGSVRYVPYCDITYLEQHGRICTLAAGEEKLTLYKRLDEVMDELDSEDFFRCHKSFAVNFRHVCTYDHDTFIMDSGYAAKISRSHMAGAKEAFAAWCAHSR